MTASGCIELIRAPGLTDRAPYAYAAVASDVRRLARVEHIALNADETASAAPTFETAADLAAALNTLRVGTRRDVAERGTVVDHDPVARGLATIGDQRSTNPERSSTAAEPNTSTQHPA
jgi:hypothetical protein